MSASDYLTSRQSLPNPSKIKRPIVITSILGRFVRKCRLEYIKLDFGQAGILWSLFKSLRAPTIKDFNIENEAITPDDLEEIFGFQIPATVPYGSIGRSCFIPYLTFGQFAAQKMTSKGSVESRSSVLKVIALCTTS
jgi:hypothetical protein